MTEEQRPDPEYLLALIKKESAKEKGGKLKIFFGMAAGVGKTYAMLSAAQQFMSEGGDVVIGTIQTHGRKETAALLENIPVIPHQFIRYKDTVFEEMDLEGILTRKPQLVLVDELAHTNIPGARHPKRWQDVMEILDAGIDVYTTLNVQHLESLKQPVEEVTVLRVRETVPDIMFERANEIELVDISPTKLLKRLKDGKVYLGSHPQVAAEHFFKEDRLTALREIALRYVAEKVDHDLQSLATSTESTDVYQVSDRLLVAVSSSPHSEYLIRAAKRLAYTINVPWVALNIDTGAYMTPEDQQRLAKNLTLARDLGAEVMTMSHPDIPTAISRAVKQYHITQIVMGRPGSRMLQEIAAGGTLLDRMTRENRDIDIFVVRQQKELKPDREHRLWSSYFTLPKTFTYYWAVLGFIALITAFNFAILPVVGWKTIGFIYLLSILTLSLFTGRGPILFGAGLSALALNFFFIPSMMNSSSNASENFIFFIVYLFTAIITGILVTRIRHREAMLVSSEEHTQLLYQIEHQIASATSPASLFVDVASLLKNIFNGDFAFALCKGTDPILFEEIESFPFDEKDKAVALWTIHHKKSAGWSTDTLPSVESLFIPLKGINIIVGVMKYHPISKVPLLPEQMHILSNICQRLANYVEKYMNIREQQNHVRKKEADNLQYNILSVVVDQLSAPLSQITSALSNFKEGKIKQEIAEAADKLEYTLNTFKDVSKLRSDLLKINPQQQHLKSCLDPAINRIKAEGNHHEILVDIPLGIPEINVDASLIDLAVIHILKNAITFTPQGTKIMIKAIKEKDEVILTIADEGPGIPPDQIDKIFERFYRVPGTERAGTGMGLAIAKAIIDMHGGHIEASNRPQGGAEFTIHLPLTVS